MDCIFCKIIKGEIKSEILFETDNFIVINDISHMANKHYLIIPKQHFAYLNEVDSQKSQILAEIMLKMKGAPGLQGSRWCFRFLAFGKFFGDFFQ